MFKLNKLAVLAPIVVAVSGAQAAVPAGAEAVFTTLATDFGTIAGYGFTALGIITGGMIVMGLVKRVAKKATS